MTINGAAGRNNGKESSEYCYSIHARSNERKFPKIMVDSDFDKKSASEYSQSQVSHASGSVISGKSSQSRNRRRKGNAKLKNYSEYSQSQNDDGSEKEKSQDANFLCIPNKK